MKDHRPLLTVGDAIASFLARPDPDARHLAPADCVDLRKSDTRRGLHRSVTADINTPRPRNLNANWQWYPKPMRFARSSASSRWIMTMALALGLITTGAALLQNGMLFDYGEERSVFRWDFGKISKITSVTAIGDIKLVQAVLLANLAQLLISSAYVSGPCQDIRNTRR